jgi:hypothetical protein
MEAYKIVEEIKWKRDHELDKVHVIRHNYIARYIYNC